MADDKDIDIIPNVVRFISDNADPKIILDNSGEGRTVRFEQDDIVPATKQKLGDHLHKITKDAGNNPVIKNDSETVSLTTGTGNPKPISDVDNNAESTFTKETVQEATTAFRKTSDSDYLKVSKDFDIRIAKGKTDDRTRITVGQFYKDINENLGNSKIAKAIEERQIEDNRYALTNQYLDPNDSITEEESGVGTAYLQQNLGTHVPRKWPNTPSNNEEISFKIKNIKNLGIQMLLESSGEYYVPENTDSIGSTLLAKAAATAPGLARMGLRVRNNRFSATEIVEQVNNKFKNNTRFPELKDNANLSYGSVNNPLVPFSALNTSNAQTGAILLATTMGIMIQALSLAIEKLGPNALTNPVAAIAGSLFGKKTANPQKSEQQYRRERLGKSSKRAQTAGDDGKNNYSLSGLTVSTTESYPSCVKRGFEIFFDAPTGGVLNQLGGTGIAAANAATGGLLGALGIDSDYDKIIDAPGYYNAILRMLVQSATADILGLVGTAVKLTGNSTNIENIGGPGPLDVNRNIGLDSDPTNLLNSIGQFQNSRVIKFMNILATLGDLDKKIKTDNGVVLDSTIDAIEDRPPEIKNDNSEKDSDASLHFPNPASLIKKSKLSDRTGDFFQGKLAWGSNTLRSMYSSPISLFNAEFTYTGLDEGYSRIKRNPNFNNSKTLNNRIEQKHVEAIERELDSYYMPFYFHDIRTNEIISFHAFMESVNDGYDADYTESETYGRIGKVYTYKNTNRNISFSFKIIATNPQDFDDMWYKINKLVTLVYPQYTAGRSIDTGNGKFIQPFSQLISNSPLIRVRLGDLFKTNYSEFDLARLFGVGTEQFNLNNSDTPAINTQNIDNINIKQEIKNRISKNPPELFVGDRIKITTQPGFSGDAVYNSESPNWKELKSPLEGTFKAEYIADGHRDCHQVELKNVDKNLPNFLALQKGPWSAVGYYIEFDEEYYDNLYPSMIQSTNTTPTLDSQTIIDNFFKPENNPIVKSFESVSGQGQAGFIKKISFDFADARWQTEGLNNRAPMWCKVDIDFAPIFDINPGLDSSGAPIGLPYNVGSLMKILKISKRKSLEKENIAYQTRKNASNIISTDKNREEGNIFNNKQTGFTNG